MRPDDVLFWQRATPFIPFRIRLNSGRTWDIRHPEMLKVGQSTALVFSYAGDAADPYEHVDMIGLRLVESIEPITAASSVP